MGAWFTLGYFWMAFKEFILPSGQPVRYTVYFCVKQPAGTPLVTPTSPTMSNGQRHDGRHYGFRLIYDRMAMRSFTYTFISTSNHLHIVKIKPHELVTFFFANLADCYTQNQGPRTMDTSTDV